MTSDKLDQIRNKLTEVCDLAIKNRRQIQANDWKSCPIRLFAESVGACKDGRFTVFDEAVVKDLLKLSQNEIYSFIDGFDGRDFDSGGCKELFSLGQELREKYQPFESKPIWSINE